MSTHDAQVRAVLSGQHAPPSAYGGRRVLYRCDTCGHPWLMDGANVQLRLDGDALAALCIELRADLSHLPYARCRICAAAGLGEINIDQYGSGSGYGISWEGLEPAGAHLLCSAIRLDWLAARRREPRAGVVTAHATCRAWLHWIERLDAPTQYHALTLADSADMARANPPGHGASGTAGWRWQGVVWQASCPPLGGRCYCSFCEAMPPGESFSIGAMFATWRLLARLIQAGRIAGEALE